MAATPTMVPAIKQPDLMLFCLPCLFDMRLFLLGEGQGAGFKPTWKDLKIDLSKEFTYNAQNPEKNLGVIDHILYKKLSATRAADGGIIEFEKPLSDHKPIWAEIVFPLRLSVPDNQPPEQGGADQPATASESKP
jgi:hypothetical protein